MCLNTNFKGAPLAEDSNIQEGDQLIVTKQEALLEVRITKVETREEEIPFSTETTQSNEYTKGTTKTLQEGQNGLRRVTMQNVYDTNGVLLEQTILSTETIREPVNKKVVVGTKKVTKNGAAAYIGGSGQFICLCRGTATARAGMAAATRAWISVPLPVRPSMHRRAAL